MQEDGLRHLMKLSVKLLLLQYPYRGPIFEPPLHIAFSFGHSLHGPGYLSYSIK